MRKLIYYVASSIDGFIAPPDRGDPTGEIFSPEGEHAEFLLAEYPETVPANWREAAGITAANRRFDTVLEGRGSYEVGLAAGVANAYTHMRHFVFSSSLTVDPDVGIELETGDPVETARRLKAEDGLDIWLCGGGKLAATLRDEIDEIHLKLNPVVLGSGAPLFDGGFQVRHHRLSASRVFGNGVALLTYVRP